MEEGWNRPHIERAPRYRIELKSSVIITASALHSQHSGDEVDDTATAVAEGEDRESFLVFQAALQDISISGLALLISFEDMLELKMMGNDEDVSLRLLLPLPVKAIELTAVPARYEPLSDSPTGQILLGAAITDMNGRDRIVFMEFVRQFEE